MRVERAFNTDAHGEIAVRGGANGGICGFSWSVGQRVGAFVTRSGDEWTTGSCSILDPDVLGAAAAKPVPHVAPPTEPPVTPAGGTPFVLQARRGSKVVYGDGRYRPDIGRLPVEPGARIRLRLDRPATSVRVALARRDGMRIGRVRAAARVARGGLVWRVTVPSPLPRRADRLIVSVGDGGPRTVAAIGLASGAMAAGGGRRPCDVAT